MKFSYWKILFKFFDNIFEILSLRLLFKKYSLLILKFCISNKEFLKFSISVVLFNSNSPFIILVSRLYVTYMFLEFSGRLFGIHPFPIYEEASARFLNEIFFVSLNKKRKDINMIKITIGIKKILIKFSY